MLKRGGRSLDEVRFVNSGAKALAQIQSSPPDLIIYYLWTFDLSGYEFCERLNTIPALGKLILLQGAVSPQLVYPEAQRAGAAGYLRQPFAPADLIAARDAVLKGGTFFPTLPEHPKQWESATDKKGRRILNCDHDPEIADLMQIMLGRGRNDELRYLPDVLLLLAAAEQNPPDLIVLPVMMPHIDGWEACKRLRMIPHLQRVPVLLYAAMYCSGEFYSLVRQVGAQGYLQMPFSPQELYAARDVLLRGETYFKWPTAE
jgi:CheY-like chemotaxis protein